MRILVVEGDRIPYITNIKNELESMQEVVGGILESLTLNDVTFILNEEGKINGECDPNRDIRASDFYPELLGDKKDRVTDTIFGTFFIVETDSAGELKNISQGMIKKYTDRFRDPEYIQVIKKYKFEEKQDENF